MEVSSMDQTQAAELHILAFYNGFLTLCHVHLPPFSFKGVLPAFMMALARIFYWKQMFHIRNLTPSFWRQSYTPTAGVLGFTSF